PVCFRVLIELASGPSGRDAGPTSPATKRGTPTMCGVVIIGAAILAYLLGHLFTGSVPTASGLLVLWLAGGLGVVGFLDDFIKIRKQRSLGLRPVLKLFGQAFVGI